MALKIKSLLKLAAISLALWSVAGVYAGAVFLAGAAFVLMPRWKWPILAMGNFFASPSTIGLTSWTSADGWYVGIAGVAASIIFIYIHRALCRRGLLPLNPVGPMCAFFLVYFSLCGLVHNLPPGSQMKLVLGWSLIGIVRVVWYFAYDLQNSAPRPMAGAARLAFYRPLWSFFFVVPIPQGERALKAKEVHDGLDRLQTKALYLSLRGAAIYAGSKFLYKFIYEENSWNSAGGGLQPISQLLQQFQLLGEKSVFSLWLDVLVDFLFHIAQFTSLGHLIISIAWFFGFAIALNTNSPLLARNPLDFFQRYNFYYKEFLFQIFFFPVFARLKKLPLMLRLYFSTWAAVGFFNFIVLWARYAERILADGVQSSFINMAPYAIYCFILVHLVFPFVVASVERPEEFSGFQRRQWFATALTIVVYAFIRIFDDDHHGPVVANLTLAARLFGWDM